MIDWTNPRAAISVTMVSFFFLVSLFSIIHIFRFTKCRARGWLVILSFAIIRMAAGLLELFIFHQEGEFYGPPDKILVAIDNLLLSIALAPLLLSLSQFGQRVIEANDFLVRADSVLFSTTGYRVLIGVNIFGMIWSIVGSCMMATKSHVKGASNLLQLSSALYIYVILFLYAEALKLYYKLDDLEDPSSVPYVYGMFLVAPLLVVRLAYGLGGAIHAADPTNKFNPLFGSWVMFLIMLFLTEAITTTIYCVCGYLAETSYLRMKPAVTGFPGIEV